MLNIEKRTKIYCGIDTELSGFDPDSAEILELGLVFFVVEDGLYKEVSRWERTFKPKGEVSSTILALTGLKMEELVASGDFEDFREEIQNLLQDAILVGHNLTLDIKFLEKYGIELSGKSVDTMDLVQILLPTCPSYNLESLMHRFKIDHSKAHRALADSIASVKLLECLHGVFQGLNTKAKDLFLEKIDGVFQNWYELFKLPILVSSEEATSLNSGEHVTDLSVEFKSNKEIINIPSNYELEDLVISLKNTQKSKNLLVVLPHSDLVKAFQEKFGLNTLVRDQEAFSYEKYLKFLEKEDKTTDELKFILKVMVWFEGNRSNINTNELNCNFFGGQFLREITGFSYVVGNAGLLFCSFETLLDLPKGFDSRKYEIVVVDADAFEKHLGFISGMRLSWGYAVNVLKSIYNPETNTGLEEYAERVTNLLASTDLFFALINLYFRPKDARSTIVSLEEVDDFHLNRVKRACENYREKLNRLYLELRAKPIKQIMLDLEGFFEESEDLIKWMEFGERFVSLQMRKLDLRESARQAFAGFLAVHIVDFGLDKLLLEYYTNRFGLEGFEKTGDFLELNELALGTLPENMLDSMHQGLLPLVVVFDSQSTLKKFYEENYEQIKSHANLLALHLTGGVKKVVNNFSIRHESVLLLTYDALLRNSHMRMKPLSVWLYEQEQVNLKHPYAIRLDVEVSRWQLDYSLCLKQKTVKLIYNMFTRKDFKVYG